MVGRGLTVGRPLGLLLTRKGLNATVTLTHTRTVDLAAEVRRADIVVAAVGVPHLVKAEDQAGRRRARRRRHPRATRRRQGRVTGDVDPAVAEVAGWLSPNPGGVGPMTRAMLLANVVEAAERHAGKADSTSGRRPTDSAVQGAAFSAQHGALRASFWDSGTANVRSFYEKTLS